jgi:hypothetical protein
MAIRTAEDLLDCFLATLGLLQGCPFSPTLFELYIFEFDNSPMATVRAGGWLDLPFLGALLEIPAWHYCMPDLWFCRRAAGGGVQQPGHQVGRGATADGSRYPAHTQAARGAMAACDQRCAALGVVTAGVRLRLFSIMVDSVLSHWRRLVGSGACRRRGSMQHPWRHV